MSIGSLFSDVFASSPVANIKEHIEKAHECVCKLLPFFEAVFKEDWSEAEHQQSIIKDLEQQADKMKRAVRLSLPKSLFLPVPRAELLKLITAQDKIANCAKDIAGLTLGRKMVFPDILKPSFQAFLQRSMDSSAQALKIINEMDTLIESGFRGPEVEIVGEMINVLEDIETDTDSQQIQLRKILYSIEETLQPIDVIFMYNVIDHVGVLADRSADLGSFVEIMLAQ